MKTIIAGSRTITDYRKLIDTIELADWEITTVLSGTARGVDRLGERYAKEEHIPLERHLAAWTKYGKSAGMKRNIDMAKAADAVIILWDGESKGAKGMMEIAIKHGLKIIVNTITSS